jgi:uncharacterized protein YaeQ
MSFVDAFITFVISLSNADSNQEASVRIKTMKHPHESMREVYGRILALCHAYRPGIECSPGRYDPSEPTLRSRSSIGELLQWVEVGALDSNKLKHAIHRSAREGVQTAFASYFLTTEELGSFCHALRGSKQNWVETVAFWLIDGPALEKLPSHPRSRFSWVVTVVDDTVYVASEGQSVEVKITPIDIWRAFQASLDLRDPTPTT